MRKRIQNLLRLASLEILVTAIIFLIALFTFSFIVHEALYEREDIFDKKVMQFFSTHSSQSFIEVMKRVTLLGSTTFLFPAYIVLIAWHISKKRTQYAIDITVIAVSSMSMMYALKQFFHRQRPELPIIKGISGFSFPSGHALSSFIFCSILMYLVWKGNLQPVTKYILIALLLLCALTIGLSRVVLNVHYATDVIGGFCLGIIWVIISFAILKKIRKNSATGNINTIS
ncbi:MAG TPA: phosphatase PAP2 family protein [Chitinophagaceae bacterium]|nr:phosphatase PAP2 family protein [Chitinophagaceae bacterium]